MPAFYSRFEGLTRSDDLAEGLAARVYDPAWILSRQWQTGELLGDDGGSPIRVRHTGRTSWCTAYADGTGRRELTPGAGPVEAIAEAVPAGRPRWLRVDIGRALQRALRTAGLNDRIPALLAAFPLPPPADLATGRVPDGALAYEAFAGPLREVPPRLPPLSGLVRDQALIDATLSWLDFCDGLIGPGANAWDPGRMEYGFALEAPGMTFEAAGHGGGELGWWAFDATTARPTGPADDYDLTTIPTRVTFHGMPVPRWWQEENAVVDLGSVEAHPADLARMAVLQFALLYGNDQFVIPARMAAGALLETTHLLVTDTFGATILVPPTAEAPGAERWTMFTLSRANEAGVAGVFLLLNNAVQPLTSAPLEEVLLQKDEMANLAWAVETTVEGQDGTAIPRAEQWHRPPVTEPVPAGQLAYRLGTTVPPHWFPLVPQRTATGDIPAFTVQTMAFSTDPAAVPLGQFVQIGRSFADDRLPREGLRLVRDVALARRTDGDTVVWGRRRATVGRGESSSGLAFDITAPT
jgi:hypothetical protein